MNENIVIYEPDQDCVHIVNTPIYYVGNGEGEGILKVKCKQCGKKRFVTGMGKFYDKLEWAHIG